ncbi:hypothetical protein L228DRAFT_250263 [Xylona heveae TC161]|uniref:Zn(2)-C6 fungal-type domain-containing protein n=1 Tax=Xylona heveae (strain CBS 132557 / TC161) TaxID=1328760 RepID=A0A165A1T7_XYLHT|nr:hypothetical protein L228DRAFT_250263 [Xylona heveae TC161]KZF19836.1 hypothetical protein L228DRAFT_250263 [Xylona heveae TC161]
MSQNNDRASSEAKSKPAFATTCVECRARHVKCDGLLPSCRRCKGAGRTCHYIKSRRGKRDTERLISPPHERKLDLSADFAPQTKFPRGPLMDDNVGNFQCLLPQPESSSLEKPYEILPNQGLLLGSPWSVADPVPFQSVVQSRDNPASSCSTPSFLPEDSASNASLSCNGEAVHFDPLVGSFYSHFHRAHPIVIPMGHWRKHVQGFEAQALMTVIHFIGSMYAEDISTTIYRDAVYRTLSIQPLQLSKTGFAVQVNLLFAIGLHAHNEPEKAIEYLNRAIDIALELGMHRSSFCYTYGENCSLLEESWRRTWWELYVVEGMFAAVHQSDSFRLFKIPTDVPIPCEEAEYSICGPIPRPRTFEEFDDRAFEDESITYSSFAYRIDAVRILGKLLALGAASLDQRDATKIQAADARLTNWTLHLPPAKRQPVDRMGRVDEIMFQGHMIINAATIFLHRPLSNLIFSHAGLKTTCTPNIAAAIPSTTAATAFSPQIHSLKAINAATTISSMFALPGTILTLHSPFCTCVVALAAVVDLSAYYSKVDPAQIPAPSSLAIGSGERDSRWLSSGSNSLDASSLEKERIQLDIGVLKAVKNVWPIARAVFEPVKAIARDLVGLMQREQERRKRGRSHLEEFAHDVPIQDFLPQLNYHTPAQEYDWMQSFVVPAMDDHWTSGSQAGSADTTDDRHSKRSKPGDEIYS